MRDLVLSIEDILDDPIVYIGKHVITRIGIDELSGDADPPTRLADTSLEDVPDVQQRSHLAYVGSLAFERERGGASRNLKSLHPRQRINDLLGDAITEIFVFFVRTHVEEGEYRDAFLPRSTVGSPSIRGGGLGGLAESRGGRATFLGHRKHRHTPTHVLEIDASEGAGEHTRLVLDVVENLPGNKHFTRRAHSLDSGGDVDAVSINSLVLSYDVPGMDPDPQRNRKRSRQGFLDLESAAHSLDGAGKYRQAAIAVVLQQLSPVWSQSVLQDGAVPIADLTRLLLIALHQGRVSGNVGEHDGSEAPCLLFDHGDLRPAKAWPART